MLQSLPELRYVATTRRRSAELDRAQNSAHHNNLPYPTIIRCYAKAYRSQDSPEVIWEEFGKLLRKALAYARSLSPIEINGELKPELLQLQVPRNLVDAMYWSDST